jgi:curved DNA-binding protein CbpA
MIIESLNSENKARFRELAKKFHPDVNKEANSEKMMQRLNDVKDDDSKFITFYNEVMGVKKPDSRKTTRFETEESEVKRPARFKTDEEWKSWHDRVKAARQKMQERERKRQRG